MKVEYGPLKAVLSVVIGITTWAMTNATDEKAKFIAGCVNAGSTALLLYLLKPPTPDSIQKDQDSEDKS